MANKQMVPIRIPLTKDCFALIDESDFSIVGPFKWHVTSRQNRAQQYATRTIGRRDTEVRIYMHNAILNPSDGLLVDHINGNGLDNRRCNLRLCTRSQNCANSRNRPSLSGYRGVTFSKSTNKWVAQINKDNRKYCLGYFEDKVRAAITYDEAAVRFFGPFAKLNFPVEGETNA